MKLTWVKHALIMVLFLMCTTFAFCTENPPVKLEIYCYRISSIRGAEVLLLKPRSKDRNTNWTFCEGELHQNETFHAAGKRIIKEIAGINTSHWDLKGTTEDNIPENKITPVVQFTCRAYAEDLVTLKQDSYVDYFWANLNDLGQISNIDETLKQALTKILVIYEQAW